MIAFRSSQWARGTQLTDIEQGQVVMLCRIAAELPDMMAGFYEWPEVESEPQEDDA